MLKILIIDDHPFLTFGVKAQFEAAGFADVTECNDYRKVSMQLEKDEPDAVLFDLHMPNFVLERDFRNIKRKHLDILFIAYTADNDDALVRRCRSMGFSGYLLKSESIAALTDKIRAIIDGKEFFPEPSQPSAAVVNKHSILTGTQLNVLKLTAEGHKNAEIATALGIREATVDYHKRNIKNILGANTSAEAVAIGRDAGWI